MTPDRSDFAKLVKSKPRKTHEFEVQGLFSLGNEVHKIAVRVPRKREQDLAFQAARKYVTALIEKGEKPEDAAEFFEDAKAAAIVSVCCLDPKHDMIPVWPSVDVVSEDLTADQIGVLVRYINEVRAKDGPTPDTLDDERVEAFATMAAVSAATDVPDAVLTPLPHPYLVHLYILTALKLKAARDELKPDV